MSCDYESTSERARCIEKNSSYITSTDNTWFLEDTNLSSQQIIFFLQSVAGPSRETSCQVVQQVGCCKDGKRNYK